MRRDMGLVRSILIALADSDRPLEAADLADSRHSTEEVAGHFQIMHEAGLIRAIESGTCSGRYTMTIADSVTWKGYEFLGAVKDDKVWSKTKRKVASKVADATLDMFMAMAVRVGSDMMGL